MQKFVAVSLLSLCVGSLALAGEITSRTISPNAPSTSTFIEPTVNANTTTKWDSVDFDQADAAKNTRFFIGYGQLDAAVKGINSDGNADVVGTRNLSGITLGGEHDLDKVGHFSLGGNYVNYSSKVARADIETVSFYGSGSIVQFHHKKTGFSANGILGVAYLTDILTRDSSDSKSDFFYGAALSFDYNTEIGVRVERRISQDLGTQDLVALVGYY